MDYIKIVFEPKSYEYIHDTSLELYLLARFFMSDVGPFSQSLIDWIIDENVEEGFANASYLEKVDNLIFIRDQFDKEIGYFSCTIPEMIQLLKEWDKIKRLNSKEIIISKDDSGKVTIQGLGKRED